MLEMPFSAFASFHRHALTQIGRGCPVSLQSGWPEEVRHQKTCPPPKMLVLDQDNPPYP